MKVKSEREVTQLCPTLSDPMDCSLPGSSVHGILQARVLEWGAIVEGYKGYRKKFIIVGKKSIISAISNNSQHYKKYNNRESSGEGNGTPLQYSCLENPMDGGAW